MSIFQKNKQIYKHWIGGGSIIIVGGINHYGKVEVKFIIGKLNSKKYTEMIDEEINTYVSQVAGNKYIFKHMITRPSTSRNL